MVVGVSSATVGKDQLGRSEALLDGEVGDERQGDSDGHNDGRPDDLYPPPLSPSHPPRPTSAYALQSTIQSANCPSSFGFSEVVQDDCGSAVGCSWAIVHCC